MRRHLLAFILLPAAIALQAADNLFPDPGFERSGSARAAHTGKRAGEFILENSSGWQPMPGVPATITVEPFATYRAEAWVKGRSEGGALLALYSYDWFSYGWWFIRNVPVKNTDKWIKVTTTFAIPTSRLTFYPLVSSRCRKVEAWVDDVRIVRVRSPEETIAAIRAKAKLNTEECCLLARWLLRQNDVSGAEKLMTRADKTAKADIACLLAQRAGGNAAERRHWMLEMIRFDCMRWADAPKRLRELAADLTPPQRLELCVEALRQTQAAPFARKAVEVLLAKAQLADENRPVAEIEAELDALEKRLPPKGGAADDALAPLREKLAQARKTLAARKAALGSARLLLGGRELSPETHQILLPDEPTETETRAARELRTHIEAITGKTLEVSPESKADPRRVPIFVGKCAALKRRGVPVDFQALGEDGIRLLMDGPALILAGNQRGVLYAVYTFLEDYCGCRWFTVDCVRVPRQGTIRVPKKLDVTYIPPFEYRDTDYPNCRDPRFAVRNKLNGIYVHATKSWGGHIKYRGFVHTFKALVPPEKYFADHPEYYSEIHGVRVGPDRTQLCLTNPDVLRIATETVRRWMRQNPDCRIISVSQNDWHNYCQCPKCTALAEKEGSQAGPLLHFVNAIADAVREERPDLIIDTLAYQYTRKPPRFVKPRPNVAVRLCSIECCFSHPLATDPFNAKFVRDIEGWNKICKRLYIWDYVINYANCIQPFPNLRVLQPNLQFFRDHGVTGVYEEANYFSKGGELAELRTYLLAKLLWNPDYDVKRGLREFCDAYYGPASRPIRRYIELLHNTVCNNHERHVRIYSPASYYLNDERLLHRAEALFDQAEAATADNPVLLHRVRVARMPIQYTRLVLGQSAFRLENDAFVATNGIRPELLEKFVRTARAEGVTHIREGGRGLLDEWVNRMRAATRPVKILRLRSPRLEAILIPDLGGRIWSLKDRKSGREVLKQFGSPQKGWQPSEGGIEEYSTAGYRAPGWNEPYKILEKGESFAVLEAALSNGFTLRRRIELAPGRPELIVTSKLINSSAAPREAQFRLHPAFAVTATGQTALWLRTGSGWTEKSLANPADPNAEKELWLRGADCPRGAWAIRDNVAGLTILNRFEPAEVAFCYANWNGAQNRVNLEEWSQAKKLGPGQSLTLRNVYRITPAMPAAAPAR